MTLTEEEREDLGRLRSKGSNKLRRVLQIPEHTIDRIKKRFAEDGFEAVLNGCPGERIYKKKADGDFEAHLVALSCGVPTEGFARGSFPVRIMKFLTCCLLIVIFVCSVAHAEVTTEVIKYKIGENIFSGYLAFDNSIKGRRPGVLVVHEWWGHNAYARNRAEMLAELGYTALALDMYGDGKLAEHPEDAKKFMMAVLGNMALVEQRFVKAKHLLQNHDTVNSEKIAAIGYCFGGGVVLHMARTGDNLDGVVSFHGSLGTKTPAHPNAIKTEVLVFSGGADPFVPPKLVAAFKEEMTKANATFTFKSYPNVKHSFTNPGADNFGERFKMPLAYDKKADEDSWAGMQVFFQKIFAD